MDLYVRVPMFSSGGQPVVIERYNALQNWQSQNKQYLKDTFSIDHLNIEPLIPKSAFKLSGNVEVRFPDDLKGLVPKGLCIRLELLSILDEIDSRDPNFRDDSIFIQIDGSKAFEYESIVRVLNAISPQCPVVFGNRPSDSFWGMTRERKAIEFFEISLLEEKYAAQIQENLGTATLPDSQAGCWGIHLSRIKELHLTARNYGLEFDLISSTLEAKIRFAYADVVLGQRTASEFNPDDSIEKMKLIRHKLRLSSEDVVSRLAAYLAKHSKDEDRKLPDIYIEGIRKLAPENRRMNFYPLRDQ